MRHFVCFSGSRMSFCLVVWKMGIHIQREFSGNGNKVGEGKIDKRRKKGKEKREKRKEKIEKEKHAGEINK